MNRYNILCESSLTIAGLDVEKLINSEDCTLFLVDDRETQSELRTLESLIKSKNKAFVLSGSNVQRKNENQSSLFLRKPFRIRDILLLLNEIILGNTIVSIDKPKEERKSLKNVKVLVCEDNICNQKVIRRMLERLGVECTLVDNGLKAVEITEKESFHIILMDCTLRLLQVNS